MTEASPDKESPKRSPATWRALLCLLGIFTLAGSATILSSADPFEARLVRIEAQDRLPSIDEALRKESIEINALLLSYADRSALWMSAYLAIEKHGDLARRMLLEYGLSIEFQQALVNFGADSILPIAYFHSNDLASLRVRHWVSEHAAKIGRWWREEETTEEMELDAYTRGLIAVAALQEKRYELLNQFDRNEEGELIRLFGESTVSVLSGFFTSGLRDLERQWRQGDEVGSSDLAWAGLDLLVMASAVKVLRVAKGARASRPGRVPVSSGASAGRLAPSLGPAAKLTMAAAAGYVVIRHPSLISGLGANLAEWMGWPARIGQFIAWSIVLALVLGVLRLLFGPALLLAAPLARGALRWVEKTNKQRQLNR